MSERYNLLINADRSIIEHSHGANYTTRFQEQVRKKLLDRCYLEIFLAKPWETFIPFDLSQFQNQIFEEFKRNLNLDLLRYSKIDWNKKDGQEIDYYKDEILGLVKDEKIEAWYLMELGIDWNKRDGVESDYYKDEILELLKDRKIWTSSLKGINWNKKDGVESDYYKDEILRLVKDGKIKSLYGLEIDWNKKDGVESDYYKDEILKLVKDGKIINEHERITSLHGLGIDWNKKDGKESDYYKDEILRLVEEGKLTSLDGIEIDWNVKEKKDGKGRDYYKDEILRLVEEGKLTSLDGIEIDWNEKDEIISDYYKEKIIKLIEDGKISISSVKGIDWNKKDGVESDYYKEIILEFFEKRKLIFIDKSEIDWNKRNGKESDYYKEIKLNLIKDGKIDDLHISEILGGTDWSKKDGIESEYYKEKLLELVKDGKISLYDISDIGINWNKKDGVESDYYKEEVLKLVEEGKIDFINDLGLDWNKKNGKESEYYKEEILKLFEEGKISSFVKGVIDWSKKDGQESDYYIKRILESYYKRYPQFRKIIDEIQQSYNPLEEIGLYKQLFFESGPHWKLLEDEKAKSVVGVENADTIKDSLESQYESKKRFLKSLLVGLYDMGTLQILAESENQKIKKLTGSQVDTYPQDDSLKDVSFVDSLSPKELNVYLLFYINKMTKLNELTIYRRMLGSFTYNEELEEGLRKNRAQIESAENNTSQTPSPEIQRLLEYKREKEAAEDKADNLIAVFNELKAKYDDIVANNMSEKVGQKFPIYMKSFTSFLQHYWEVKDNPDSKQVDGKSVNGQLLEFFELFNSKIDELQNDGIDINEVRNLFIFSSRALTFQETLYKLKDNITEYLIDYSKQNEEDLQIRYVDLEKQGKSTPGYAVFIYTPSIPFPISVHVEDISDFDIDPNCEVDNGCVLNSFGEKVSMNYVEPLPTDPDGASILEKQLGQLDFRSLMINNNPMSVFKYGFDVAKKYLGYKIANKRLLNPSEGRIDRDIVKCFIQMNEDQIDQREFIEFVASQKMTSDPQIEFLNESRLQSRDALQADYVSHIEELEKVDAKTYKQKIGNISIDLWDCINSTIEDLEANQYVSPDAFDEFMKELQGDLGNLSPKIINGRKNKLIGELIKKAKTQGSSLQTYTKEEKEEQAAAYKEDFNVRYEGIKGDLAKKAKKDILVLINDMKRNGYISTYKYVEVMSLIQKNIDSPEAKNLTIDEINSKIGELQTLVSSGSIDANGNTNGNSQKMTMEELAERLAGIYVGKEQLREKESNGEKTANSEKTSNDEKSSYLISVDDIAKWVLNLKQLPQQLYQKVKSIVFQAKRKLVMSMSEDEIEEILQEKRNGSNQSR